MLTTKSVLRPLRLKGTAFLLAAATLGLTTGCNPNSNNASNPIDSESTSGSGSGSSNEPITGPANDSTNTAVAPERPSEAVELESLPEGEGEAEGTFSISQVMELAHQNKLYRDFFDGEFEAQVGERLVMLYESLPSQSSPKGDDDDWKERSTNLLNAAKDVLAGKDDSVAAFKRAVNCNSCHSRHKP